MEFNFSQFVFCMIFYNQQTGFQITLKKNNYLGLYSYSLFYNFSILGQGTLNWHYAEVYTHFLSLLFLNHIVISQGYRAVQPIFSPCVVTEEIRGTKYIFMLNVRNWGAQSSARFQHPKNAVLLKQRYGITGVDLALMCTVTSA